MLSPRKQFLLLLLGSFWSQSDNIFFILVPFRCKLSNSYIKLNPIDQVGPTSLHLLLFHVLCWRGCYIKVQLFGRWKRCVLFIIAAFFCVNPASILKGFREVKSTPSSPASKRSSGHLDKASVFVEM